MIASDLNVVPRQVRDLTFIMTVGLVGRGDRSHALRPCLHSGAMGIPLWHAVVTPSIYSVMAMATGDNNALDPCCFILHPKSSLSEQ